MPLIAANPFTKNYKQYFFPYTYVDARTTRICLNLNVKHP